jgi:hypothetical protein
MPNPKLTNPTLPIEGFENESVTTLTEGMGVVRGTAEDQCDIGAADDLVLGVVALSTETATGLVAPLHIGHGGTCYVRSGAAFAVDALLTIDNAGRWVTAATGEKVQAQANGAAAAADELIAATRLDGLSEAP